jgi:O-palmitoleoyl-L-serine hydrolase
MLFSAFLFTVASVTSAAGRDLTLNLNKVSQSTSPNAKCMDGTAPAYYFREGVAAGATSAIIYLEGGGWCYPSDNEQANGANCAYRSKTGLGSSTSYGEKIGSTGYEGGSGFTSGVSDITAFANFSVSYVKYCDGGSMTGTRMAPVPGYNGSGPLYYRGHYNLEAQLDHMVATHHLDTYKEVVLAGCSAGGMACYVKCEYVASYFAVHSIPVKCICDAGMFLDIETVTGAGNVMQKRYHDIADVMESKPGLPAACVAGEEDWRQCIFSQHALKYHTTPTFVINSLYNFGEWAMLASSWLDSGNAPADWQSCWPKNGGLSPETYKTCNSTQLGIIQHWYEQFLLASAPATDPASPHGIFADSCPNQHCQTSTGWQMVKVNGTTMADAAARWYFQSSVEKHVDAPFMQPFNPSCGLKEGVQPACNNCANTGLGSNCLWDEEKQTFHGIQQ